MWHSRCGGFRVAFHRGIIIALNDLAQVPRLSEFFNLQENIIMKHSLIKTAIGAGLLAISLGASAQSLNNKTFAEGMIFYKPVGANINYIAFVPSGNQSTDSVLMMELVQNGTTGAGTTWSYGTSADLADVSAGGPTWSVKISNKASVSASNFWTFNTYNVLGVLDTINSIPNGTDGSSAYTWFGGGGTDVIDIDIYLTSTISATPCYVTFNAAVDTAGNLSFPTNSIDVKASVTHPALYMYASNANVTKAGVSN